MSNLLRVYKHAWAQCIPYNYMLSEGSADRCHILCSTAVASYHVVVMIRYEYPILGSWDMLFWFADDSSTAVMMSGVSFNHFSVV